jgi:hypothetical protein
MNIPSDIGFVFPMRPDCPCNFDFTSVCLYRMFLPLQMDHATRDGRAHAAICQKARMLTRITRRSSLSGGQHSGPQRLTELSEDKEVAVSHVAGESDSDTITTLVFGRHRAVKFGIIPRSGHS